MSLKHAILVMLEQEPSSGYDLLRHFKQSLGYFWNAKHQQIYQQLKALRGQGLINCATEKQSGKPDKKIYSITESGQQALIEWLKEPATPNRINDSLLVKIYGGHLSTPDQLNEELERHIEIHKQTLAALKSLETKYFALDEQGKDHYKLPFITLRRGILGEEAWLAWANETSQMFKK
jgi:DNA-binding PadR family transcriptional regulator